MRSVFFWSEEHVRVAGTPGRVLDLNEAAEVVGTAQASLFGFA